MRLKWHEWHSNDGMIHKWGFLDRNELGMMGWHWNDGMRLK